jgi:hypothetical protein
MMYSPAFLAHTDQHGNNKRVEGERVSGEEGFNLTGANGGNGEIFKNTLFSLLPLVQHRQTVENLGWRVRLVKIISVALINDRKN